MKKLYFFISFVWCISGLAQEIEIELFASGISSPVNIKNAGDSRLFVLEQSGVIKIINDSGTVNAQPFLDINENVSDAQDERGLLGLDFHPDYASNGYFYVNYVNNIDETIISRFSRSNGNNDIADENSELVLMTIPQPYENHNGGELVFGEDGFLYIALGDGGDGGDPQDRAQTLTTFLGKILRIDVDVNENGNNYGIPAGNPFVGNPDALDEIWAYGLRNPWKFSFDTTANDIWIADVGQENIEEINKVAVSESGVNYGWRCYEGNAAYNLDECPDLSTLTFPVSQYSHSNSGAPKCSITGGYRYRGTAQPNLVGIYFFADYCSGEIGMLKENAGSWTMTFSQAFTGNNWTTLGEDNSGELYIGDINSGNIYKIMDTTLSMENIDLTKLKIYPNPVNDELTIDFGAPSNKISEIFVYNIQGQQMKSLITFESNLSRISTKNLSSGLYVLEIHTDNGQKTIQKFIKN